MVNDKKKRSLLRRVWPYVLLAIYFVHLNIGNLQKTNVVKNTLESVRNAEPRRVILSQNQHNGSVSQPAHRRQQQAAYSGEPKAVKKNKAKLLLSEDSAAKSNNKTLRERLGIDYIRAKTMLNKDSVAKSNETSSPDKIAGTTWIGQNKYLVSQEGRLMNEECLKRRLNSMHHGDLYEGVVALKGCNSDLSFPCVTRQELIRTARIRGAYITVDNTFAWQKKVLTDHADIYAFLHKWREAWPELNLMRHDGTYSDIIGMGVAMGLIGTLDYFSKIPAEDYDVLVIMEDDAIPFNATEMDKRFRLGLESWPPQSVMQLLGGTHIKPVSQPQLQAGITRISYSHGAYAWAVRRSHIRCLLSHLRLSFRNILPRIKRGERYIFAIDTFLWYNENFAHHPGLTARNLSDLNVVATPLIATHPASYYSLTENMKMGLSKTINNPRWWEYSHI